MLANTYRALLLALPAGLLAVSLGCDYEAPHSEDYRQETPPNVISGEVVLAIPIEQELGHVVLLATDASNPGPPEGTGFPYTFTTVPPSAFTRGTDGLLSANFTITELYDADWLITGFMDVDNDFSALFGEFGGATCGDVLGAHIDSVTTQNIVPVTATGGDHVENIAVTLGQQLTVERPAFTIETAQLDGSSGNGPDIDLAYNGPFPQAFVVRATPIHAEVQGLNYDLDGPFDLTDPQECQTGILVVANDKDGDGVIDFHPLFGDPVLDITPQVYLTFLGESQNEDGTWNSSLGPNESWAGLAAYSILALQPLRDMARADGRDNDADGVVDESTEEPVNTPFLLPEATLMWLPAGLHTDGDEDWLETDPLALPRGHWDITLISDSGQTWTVPNDLAYFPSTDSAYDPARQAETLQTFGPE
ncbi:MAG: hypothetical protein EP330_11840 [Deltaproteobacteria bacterium]|nr:MAG: hypothetical protein EP330_11840 [Deltaproteobacteria bacterium]